MLRYLLPSFLMFILLSSGYAVDPIPPGTEFGTAYVRVTDCISGAAVAGASVNLDNPTHRTSSITNSTGHASVNVFAWFYSYYVTASGYRIEAGQRRFSIGEVFQICIVPEAAGFWRVVATVIAWQGDIHAGGSGWAIIRMKNLEAGVFNITEFQIWLSGYDGPAITFSKPEGVVLGRLVDRDINITIRPNADVPVGRLKAELKFKAVFTGDDGRRIGPLTVSTDLDYVVIEPYRTFRFRVTDYWGLNPVPDATVEMTSTLPGATATFLYKSDENGYVEIRRMNEGAYLTKIFYLSPYDGRLHLANQIYPILADLAKNPTVKTYLYEAHVVLKDLANRPLDTEVFLNGVKTYSANGTAKFVNVPAGTYRFKASWLGVEVFEADLKVSEPLVKNSPGGTLEATAQVGDLKINIKKADGKNVDLPLLIRLSPIQRTAQNTTSPTFDRLPKGAYQIEIEAYNTFKNKFVPVGQTTLRIPENHGENTVNVAVFDADVEITDYEGRKLVDAAVTVEGRPMPVRDGKISLKDITAGAYGFEAVWKGFKVLDTVVVLRPGVQTSLKAEIYAMRIKVVGVDGSEISKAKALLQLGNTAVERQVVNGTVVFEEVPAGMHLLKIFLDDAEIYSEPMQTVQNTQITVKAGYVVLFFKDHRGAPVAGVAVEAPNLGSTTTKADGTATLGQKPLGSYRFTAKYRGFTVFEAVAKAGERTEFTLPLYSFRVSVVNEFNTPLEATIEAVRGDVSLGRFTSSEALFVAVPPGPYQIRTAVGTKNVEQQVLVTGDGQFFTVKMPVALVLGNLTLSLQELITILLPVIVMVVGITSTVVLRRTVSRARGRAKGRV
ncbi:MAG: carboxypeptidase-like regulatory domain-containing protein [Candidatus Caldarchaeum sp.]|nr:carboxypeptidase-like regulatory domain-containing protein [Candidatus Caldarchaeum sp.]